MSDEKNIKDIRYLYVIDNTINKKQYIGLTKNPEKRWERHIDKAKTKNPNMLINRAMKKHGIENFKMTVICGCDTLEKTNKTEQVLIKQYNSLVPNGYNVSPGGGAISYEGADMSKYCFSKNKLSKEQVLIIAKQLLIKNNEQLAKEHNVSPITINGIRNGFRWRHITKIPIYSNPRPIIKWTEDEKKQITQMYQNNISVAYIATHFNKTYANIYDLLLTLKIRTIKPNEENHRGQPSGKDIREIYKQKPADLNSDNSELIKKLVLQYHIQPFTIKGIWNETIYSSYTSSNIVVRVKGEPKTITMETVNEMIKLYQSDMLMKDIAKHFTISRDILAGILSGETWSHITGILSKQIVDGKRHRPGPTKLTQKEVLIIYQQKPAKISRGAGVAKKIAKQYNISRETVSKIWNGNRWGAITGQKKLPKS